jgi:hypothetical protein
MTDIMAAINNLEHTIHLAIIAEETELRARSPKSLKARKAAWKDVKAARLKLKALIKDLTKEALRAQAEQG